MASWHETYEGGSKEAEDRLFIELARVMTEVQAQNRESSCARLPLRTLHARIIAGIANARLEMDRDMPEPWRVGHFQPGAILPAVVRLSNASGVPQGDNINDMRGMAIRLSLPDGTFHDLLATNFPVSHARNARQFVHFARIASGDKATFRERLVSHFGEEETLRMLANVTRAMRPCASVAVETFWSRGAFLWRDMPVRFLILPQSAPGPAGATLFDEIAGRLRVAEVCYRLAIQPFVDMEATPLEDASVEWLPSVSPAVSIGTLILPQQDIAIDGAMNSRLVDGLAFNPWNAPAAFRPLGNLNRARRLVYATSAAHWKPGARPPH